MVTIYDGPTSSDPVLIETSSDGVKFATFSTSSTLLVTFISDSSYQTGNGWRLDYVRIVHSPFFSYNNGDVTNWNVDISYAASPTININGGLTLLEEQAAGSPSSASMIHKFVSFSCCVATVCKNHSLFSTAIDQHDRFSSGDFSFFSKFSWNVHFRWPLVGIWHLSKCQCNL